MLTWLLVDEILVARYVDYEFSSFSLKGEITYYLKMHGLTFICIHEEANASCCLLQIMHQRFLGRSIRREQSSL